MEQQFIKVSGENFVFHDRKIVLRGFGVGSWMNLEHFMIGLPGTEHQIKQAFTEVYGQEGMESFFDKFLTNFLDENDFRFFKELGINVLRLPVNYHYFLDDQNPKQYLMQGFQYLDHVISLCEKHNIYAIIELHTAPGGQNPDWHCDTHSGLPLFWEYAALRESFTGMWRFIAEHYRNNPWIAGYDILNEPSFVPSAAIINEFFTQTIAAIRQVDPNHVIFLEGNNFAKDFSFLAGPQDPQVAYSFHYYPTVDDPTMFDRDFPVERRKKYFRENFLPLLQIREKFHRPLWCGELGVIFNKETIEFERELIREMLDLCEEFNVSWTIWAYKDAQRMGIVFPKDVTPWMHLTNRIRKEWDQSREMSMGEEAVDYLCQKYFKPVGTDLRYALQFRIRTLFHTICVEEYLKPALRDISKEQLPNLAESFAFKNCGYWDELVSLIQEYTFT